MTTFTRLLSNPQNTVSIGSMCSSLFQSLGVGGEAVFYFLLPEKPRWGILTNPYPMTAQAQEALQTVEAFYKKQLALPAASGPRSKL